ncbi:uncharacterized protein LOC122077872 [Macadamia integrifolia]|uniref:uncharacterized protein LOC122077872 n=1 Tax=Macadamia integrifolia TaxID=60698 RepID=UPI001C4EE5CE|nr:uncharacterized protein LOC122077872 [Macadamia integrifolia]XP_042499706.1 uncharacterized protein LOC122077872 [Macadamia integrifolia]XP_042499707.1 uncharacterized protein LOC122077872 [Macadamia integrifolia]XP_042499708.1 uncharacterized protein LOC122077872 [Macadamia integrifolia]
MKLDNEPMHDHSTLVVRPVSKYSVNPLEMGDLKSDNEILNEVKNRMPSDVKSQNCEKDVVQLPSEKHNEDRVGKIPVLLNSNSIENDDFINGIGKKMEDSVVPYTIPSNKVELSEKEGECYTDKSVMEYEVPEKIAFFKVDAYHVVKDICIDEGVPSLDKVLVEHRKEDSNHSLQTSYLDFNEVSKKSVDYRSLISEEMKSLVVDYHNMDVSGQCDSENILQKSEENVDAKGDITHNELVEHNLDENVCMQCCSKNQLQKREANIDYKDEIPHDKGESVVTENMLLFQNLEKENCHIESLKLESNEGKKHCGQEQLHSLENLLQKNEGNIDANDESTKGVSDVAVPLNVLLLQEIDIQNSHPASSSFNGNEDQEHSKQDTSKEPIAAHCAVCSVAEEPSERNCVNNVPFDSKVESGSITFNFDSPTTSSREDSPQNADHHPRQTLPGGLEDGTLDSLTSSSRSFFIQHGHGESSFSAVGPLSGPISHSGPVPYSGSISLRSDSSTTSTRSFAFPVLPSEWNSSPVKMAKADRRHFRKHRGWRLNILCCRF